MRNNLWDWQSLTPVTGYAKFFQFCDALEVKDGVSATASGWGVDHALAAWGKFWTSGYLADRGLSHPLPCASHADLMFSLRRPGYRVCILDLTPTKARAHSVPIGPALEHTIRTTSSSATSHSTTPGAPGSGLCTYCIYLYDQIFYLCPLQLQRGWILPR